MVLSNTAKSARWKMKNTQHVAEYQRKYQRDHYDGSVRKEGKAKLYVWHKASRVFLSILVEQ